MNKGRKKIVIVTSTFIALLVIYIISRNSILQAYYNHKDKIINDFVIGKVEASVEEPDYIDKRIIGPNEEIVKNPILSNTGEIQSYIRAQVYVPITKELKYVDIDENVVVPNEEIEVVSYNENLGWQKVLRR